MSQTTNGAPPFIIITDIDGPLVNQDFILFLVAIKQKITGKKKDSFAVHGDHKKLYNFKRFNKFKRFWLNRGIRIYTRIWPVRSEAAPVLNELMQYNTILNKMTKTYTGTEDSKVGDRVRANRANKLIKSNIPFDELFFVDSNKVEEYNALGADVAIEDNYRYTLDQAAVNNKVILFPTRDNVHIKADNELIYRPDDYVPKRSKSTKPFFKDGKLPEWLDGSTWYEKTAHIDNLLENWNPTYNRNTWQIIGMIILDMMEEKQRQYEEAYGCQNDKGRGLYLRPQNNFKKKSGTISIIRH